MNDKWVFPMTFESVSPKKALTGVSIEIYWAIYTCDDGLIIKLGLSIAIF